MRPATAIEKQKYLDYKQSIYLKDQAHDFKAWRIKQRLKGKIQYDLLNASNKLSFLMRFIVPVIRAQETGTPFDSNILNNKFQNNEGFAFDEMIYKKDTWLFRDNLKTRIESEFNALIQPALKEMYQLLKHFIDDVFGPTTHQSKQAFTTLNTKLTLLLDDMSFSQLTQSTLETYVENHQLLIKMVLKPQIRPDGTASAKRIQAAPLGAASATLFTPAKRSKSQDTITLPPKTPETSRESSIRLALSQSD